MTDIKQWKHSLSKLHANNSFSATTATHTHTKLHVSPVNSATLAAAFSANPTCVFIPVPTAVPPTKQPNYFTCVQT